MPPTLEKLKGHIALGISVRPAVCPSVRASIQNLLRYSLEFHILISHQEIIDTSFFKSELSPSVELCPF